MPLLLIGALFVSLKKFSRLNYLLPVIFIVLTLMNAPNIIQTFYWLTGSQNYISPFIFLNIFLGFLVFPPKKLNMFWPTLLLFIAGGFSEAYALTQIVFLVFVFIMLKTIKFSANESRIKIVLWGLAGGIASLIMMSLAPGNIARGLTVTQPESIKYVLVSTLYGTKWYLLRMITIKPFIYSLLLMFTAIWVLVKPIKLKIRDAIILGALSVLALVSTTSAVIASGFYSMSILPPERTLFIAIYFIFICFVVFSIALKIILTRLISNKSLNWFVWGMVLLNLFTSILLIKSTVSHWDQIKNEIQTYARTFDNLEPTLVNSRDQDLVTKNIKSVGELDSFTDNKGWVASCLAGYYQLKSIKIAE